MGKKLEIGFRKVADDLFRFSREWVAIHRGGYIAILEFIHFITSGENHISKYLYLPFATVSFFSTGPQATLILYRNTQLAPQMGDFVGVCQHDDPHPNVVYQCLRRPSPAPVQSLLRPVKLPFCGPKTDTMKVSEMK